VVIRPARPEDRDAIAAIQAASPEASSWDPFDYAVTVAEVAGAVAGFLVIRRVTAEECEILNLAVAPPFRRRGIASALLQLLLDSAAGDIFLEVRESNTPARQLYESLGFTKIGSRPAYYSEPREAGIVMNFHSC
jgi:ribosomal-protein-alanine N-acetyltransferase